MIDLIQIIILIGLTIGSFTDMKIREVPDWINFSLIAIGFAIASLSSLILSIWDPLIFTLAGFLLCLIIALLMFYTGQWGGGDSKMIMGLGALIGLNIFKIEYINYSLISFLVNILLIGAFYGIFWSIILSIKNRKKFVKETKKVFSKRKEINIFLTIALIITIILITIIQNFFAQAIIFLTLMLILLYFMWYFIKIVEKACMFKNVTPDKLTEGDWIANNIKIEGKLITGPSDLGISKKQIRQLIKFSKLKKINKVKIKEGIPFIPSFLIAFILTMIYGNLLFLLI